MFSKANYVEAFQCLLERKECPIFEIEMARFNWSFLRVHALNLLQAAVYPDDSWGDGGLFGCTIAWNEVDKGSAFVL